MELEKKILSGSAFILTSRAINMVSLIIFSITMARLLGRDTYGLISIAVGFIGIFAILGDVGLNIAGIRYISMFYAKKRYKDIRTIVRISLVIKLFLGIVLALICFFGSELFADFFNKNVAPLFRIIALVIICNLLGSVFQSVMKGLQRMDLFAGSNIFRDVSWIIVSIGLVVNGWGVVGAMWGYLVAAVIWLFICALIYVIPIRMILPRTQKKRTLSSRKIRNSLIVFGLPIVIMDITVLLYNWTDTFVLAYFRPTWEVSCYNIAFGLINIVMIIIASVSTTLFPIFSHDQALKNKASQKRIYEKVVKLVTMVVYPILTFMIFLAPYLILIYGEQYLPALAPLYILALWGFFRPVGNIGSGLLTAKGRQRLVMRITISMAVLNLVMNIILIPPFHMIGAAVATTIAFIFGSLVTYAILVRDYDITLEMKNIMKCLFVAILASGLGFGVFFAINLLAVTQEGLAGLLYLVIKLFVALLLAGLVYLYLLKFINIFSADELKMFEKLAGEYRIVRPIIGILR